jgi:hypothetical protein
VLQLLFTLLFYANVVPVCTYFAPAHQQTIITRVFNQTSEDRKVHMQIQRRSETEDNSMVI